MLSAILAILALTYLRSTVAKVIAWALASILAVGAIAPEPPPSDTSDQPVDPEHSKKVRTCGKRNYHDFS